MHAAITCMLATAFEWRGPLRWVSELEASHDRAGALARDRAVERPDGRAETAAVQPVLGPEVNFVGACAKLPRLIPPGAVAVVGICRRLRMFVNSTRMFRL